MNEFSKEGVLWVSIQTPNAKKRVMFILSFSLFFVLHLHASQRGSSPRRGDAGGGHATRRGADRPGGDGGRSRGAGGGSRRHRYAFAHYIAGNMGKEDSG